MKHGRIAAVSGGFDPLHIGHIRLFRRARALCKQLCVIVESDEWIKKNKHESFMPLGDRIQIVRELETVDFVLANHDIDSCSSLLASLRPDYFVVGPDHSDETKLPEYETCRQLGIQIVCIPLLVKDRSSSEFIERAMSNARGMDQPASDGQYGGSAVGIK